MKPHVRTLLFCVAFLAAPIVYLIGNHLGGIVLAAPLAAGTLLGTFLYSHAAEARAARSDDAPPAAPGPPEVRPGARRRAS